MTVKSFVKKDVKYDVKNCVKKDVILFRPQRLGRVARLAWTDDLHIAQLRSSNHPDCGEHQRIGGRGRKLLAGLLAHAAHECGELRLCELHIACLETQ
jgi:hypothetical protein